MKFIKTVLFVGAAFLLSPVFHSSAMAEESVCLTCHVKEAAEWRKSIHAANGISCHNCHGGNPKDADTAMDPKNGFVGSPSEAEIPEFCGKCHAGVKENYIKSEHGEMLSKGGPSCVTCHSAHKQEKAKIELISESLCGQCHSFERAAKIKNAMLMSETEITNLEERIDTLRIQGYDVDAQKKELFATRNQFHRLTHSVDVDTILKETTGIQAEIGRLKGVISTSEKSEVRRKIYGSILIAFLFIGALIFWWYRNTVLEEEDERKS